MIHTIGFPVLIFLLLGTALGNQSSTSVVITHVTIIDTRGGPARRDMNVIIQGDRIASIEKGNTKLRPGAIVLDGRGKFLIPGLWDMQVHLSWTTASALPLLVANGITNVRDMGGPLEEIDDWRTKIRAGLLVGPDIVRVGPMLKARALIATSWLRELLRRREASFALSNSSELMGSKLSGEWSETLILRSLTKREMGACQLVVIFP